MSYDFTWLEWAKTSNIWVRSRLNVHIHGVIFQKCFNYLIFLQLNGRHDEELVLWYLKREIKLDQRYDDRIFLICNSYIQNWIYTVCKFKIASNCDLWFRENYRWQRCIGNQNSEIFLISLFWYVVILPMNMSSKQGEKGWRKPEHNQFSP